MADETQVNLITENVRERAETETRDISDLEVPAGVEVFEIYGSLFFGAIERFKDAIRRIEKSPKVLIIRMRNVVAIDASGLQTLEELLESCHRKNMSLLLSGVAPQPIAAMRQSGLLGRLGEENALDNIYEALSRAKAIIEVHQTKPPK